MSGGSENLPHTMRRSAKGSTAEREARGSTASRGGERNERREAAALPLAPSEAEWQEFSRDYANGRYRQVLKRRSQRVMLIVVGVVAALMLVVVLVRLALAA